MCGSKHATSSSQVSIPPEVLARYNAVNARAEKAASTPFKAFGNTASDYVAQMNSQQNAGIADINATAGSYQPYMDAAKAATTGAMGPSYEGIDKYMSPYIQNVADTTGAMMRQSNEQAQSGALGAAAASGAFGGDRAGVAAANMNQQNQMAYGKTMADIYNQGYGQAMGAHQSDLARQMAGGQQLAGLGAQSQALGLQGAQAKIGAGTMQQQTEQAGKTAMIDRFMQEQGYPFQVAQFLANIAMGTGAQSGSTTTSKTPTGLFGNLATGGKVEGYAGGGGVPGPMSSSQNGVGGAGYVPEGVLPVGQLMIAETPPQQEKKGGLGDILKLFEMASGPGMASGGVAGGRHGYATDGGVLDEETLRRAVANRRFLHPEQYRNEPDAGTMAAPTNPANMGLAGHMHDVPQSLGASPTSRVVTLPGVGNQPQSYDPVPAIPSPPSSSVVTLPGVGNQPQSFAPVPAIPTPSAGLGGISSDQRPMPRPAGLAGADVAKDAMSTLGTDPASGMKTVQVNDAPAPASVPEAKPSQVTTMTDTGKVPTGVVAPVVPLNKQIEFMVQEPEFKRYLSHDYSSPAEAANGMDQYYEISGGKNTAEAAAYANDVYKAAQSGDMSGLPANAQTVYAALIQKGIDPVKAAGTVGRLMVESYARVDPNARNTLGGGNGTIGIAQWRGDRMKNLADFAGVPLDAITGAPVTTPEGRYYSTTGVGGGNSVAVNDNKEGLGGADASAQKPYAERNAVGQFFHNPDGSMNRNAVLSLLAGLGTMASSRTTSPIAALLQGVGGGAAAYNNLQNQEPARVAATMANSKNARMMYQQQLAVDPEHTPPFEQWAASLFGGGQSSMVGAPGSNPGAPAATGSYQGIPLDMFGRGMSQPITLSNGAVVQAGQSYGYLNALANELQGKVSLGIVDPSVLANVQAKIADIEAHEGQVQTIDGKSVQDPTYTEILNSQTKANFGRGASIEFQKKSNDRKPQLDQELTEIKNQADVFTKFNAGALATEKANAFAVLGAFGVPVPADSSQYAAAAQEAVKNAARKVLASVNTTAPSAEMNKLMEAVENPNMQPEAIKMILSLQQAQSMRELDYYKLRPEWNSANPSQAMDQSAYDAWFAENKNFAQYYDNAKKSMPIFAGEVGSKDKPYKLNPGKDANGNFSQADIDYNNLPPGAVYVDPNGVVKQKPKG